VWNDDADVCMCSIAEICAAAAMRPVAIIIPAKAFAGDYGITGVRLSVRLSVCLSVCLLPR